MIKARHQTDKLDLLCCDVMEGLRVLSDESIHCVVTSPPYWGIRDYGIRPSVWGGDVSCHHQWDATKTCTSCGAWRGCLGLEPTLEFFLEHIVDVFREVKRVLRGDGVIWVNMGDCYATSGSGKSAPSNSTIPDGVASSSFRSARYLIPGQQNTAVGKIKPKDMVGMPWAVAFALRNDGWYLRSSVVWHKPNPMPEGATDRPTKSYEHVFLLSPSDRYYYDADAVKETAIRAGDIPGGTERGRGIFGVKPGWGKNEVPENRNLRDVWTIPTQSYSEPHFASFPERLVEPCIKAGTSEKGCCSKCGAPWKRVVETETDEAPMYEDGLLDVTKEIIRSKNEWNPSCQCGEGTVRCTVLDPFMGRGTTGVVAMNLGRKFVGIELSSKYYDFALGNIIPVASREMFDLSV